MPSRVRRRTAGGACALFFFQRCRDPRDLHSFPTRRSSDLPGIQPPCAGGPDWSGLARFCPESRVPVPTRSEEHTSELQSHSDLVCRLLLEKKNSKMTETPFLRVISLGLSSNLFAVMCTNCS